MTKRKSTLQKSKPKSSSASQRKKAVKKSILSSKSKASKEKVKISKSYRGTKQKASINDTSRALTPVATDAPDGLDRVHDTDGPKFFGLQSLFSSSSTSVSDPMDQDVLPTSSTGRAISSKGINLLVFNKLAYKMNHEKRGRCLIVNNVEFNNKREHKTRLGSDVDANRLKQVFTALGFDVLKRDDVTTRELEELITTEASANHSAEDCYVCCILSHGTTGDIIYTKDGEMSLDTIIEQFKPNKQGVTLAGKPKIFFVQACRGTEYVSGVSIKSDFDDDMMSQRPGLLEVDARKRDVRIPTEADFLVAYSVTKGYRAFRYEDTGSWFIQTLCGKLEELAQPAAATNPSCQAPRDLLSVLTRVCYDVAYKYETATSVPKTNQKKQSPAILSTLTKLVYLTPHNP